MTGYAQAGLFMAPPSPHVSGTAPMPKNASTDLREPSKGHLRPGIGTNQCVCYSCGEAFNSVSAFDRHQRLGRGGVTICTHPLDIKDKDGNPKPMVKNARGWWVTSLREMDDPA